MIKFGNCRIEVNQNDSSYRRCITDLDTNTVVEEDYGNTTISGNSFPHFNQHGGNGYSPRKRPLSPFFIDHLGVFQEIIDDCTDARGNSLCNLIMLTTSPKRVKL